VELHLAIFFPKQQWIGLSLPWWNDSGIGLPWSTSVEYFGLLLWNLRFHPVCAAIWEHLIAFWIIKIYI
jgi:hypothetical protein